MINTVFHFVNDPTFDYMTAVRNGDISEYTIVFNVADHSIWAKNSMFGRMSRLDIIQSIGNISDIIPAATSNDMGGIKIGYTSDVVDGSRTYAVELDENNRAYVNVPWTDTITPQFDDTALQEAINAQKNRIDGYINNLADNVQDLTESLLVDTQWVTDNLYEGEVGRQIKDWTDQYMQQYGVWEWVDPNDESKGRIIKTSVIEQNVDSIDLRVGAVETYKDGALATALSNISQTVGVDLATGQTIANTGLTSSVADLNAETGAIDRAIIAALDLKAEKQNGTYEAITDLASVYSDNTKSLYSGLNQRVTTAENSLSSEVSLMSRIANNNGQIKTDALAGFLASTEFSNGVTSATSSMSSSIDDVTAAVATKVSKDSNGKIESSVTISAEQIYLSGTTFAGTIFADFVDTNTLNANYATINYLQANYATISTLQADYATINDLNAAKARIGSLETNEITIGNAAAAAQTAADNAQTTANNTNAEFIRLANGNGTFTGNVNAKTLIAGDPSGINIRTSSDKIEFCQGADVRAYFVSNGDGMQLHVWDSNGVEHYIDFTNWQSVSGTSYSTVSGYYRISSTGFTEAQNIEKGSDGIYYIHSGSQYTPVSEDLYTKQNVNTTDSNGQGIPCIFAKYNNQNAGGAAYAINVDVDRYIKHTFSNGSVSSVDSNYVYYCDRYPQVLAFNGTSVNANSSQFTGKFINPVGGNSEFAFRYIYGSTEQLNPTVQYTYIDTTSYTSTYSTSPTLYYPSGNPQV